MSGRRNDHQLVAEKWNDRQVRILARRTDDRKVKGAVEDLLLDSGA